jgi:5'(3')-deoxyribonucleotidase
MALTDSLVGPNVFAHIRHTLELKERTLWYFRTQSKLWKAIVEHICHDKNVILAPKPVDDAVVAMHRGTGPAISLKDVGVWGQDIKEGKDDQGKFTGYIFREVAFWMKVKVDWYSEEVGDEVHREYKLDHVPCILELEFSNKKFDEWVESLAQEKAANITISMMEKLAEKLPECDERRRITSEIDKIRSKFRVKIP